MAKRKTNQTIIGPDGQTYPASIIDKQIVKRDELVRRIVAQAERLSAYVKRQNEQITQDVMDFLEETADEFGENWQGNTILTTFDGSQTVEVNVKQRVQYDERLAVAGEKIRSWLDSKLAEETDEKKRELLQNVMQIAKTALSIDGQGKVDRNKILQLKKFSFTNAPEWEEAMALITASEQPVGTKRYIRFKKADESGRLMGIPVDFSGF